MVEMQEGGLLPQPDGCPSDIYGIICDCWTQDPKARPAVAVGQKAGADSLAIRSAGLALPAFSRRWHHVLLCCPRLL